MSRESNLFITINTNFRSTNLDDIYAVSRGLEQACETIFNDTKHLHTILGTQNFDVNVTDVEVEYAVEKGPRNGSIHAHVLLLVEHNDYVVLKGMNARIKELFRQLLGISVYVDIKLKGRKRNSVLNAREYLQKQTGQLDEDDI